MCLARGRAVPIRTRRFEPPQGMTVRLPMLMRYVSGSYRPVVWLEINGRRRRAELRSGFLASAVSYRAARQSGMRLALKGEGSLVERLQPVPVLLAPGAPEALAAGAGVVRLGQMRMYDALFAVLNERGGMKVFPPGFRPAAEVVLGYDFIRAFNYVVLDPRVGQVILSTGELHPEPEERMVAALTLLDPRRAVTVGILDGNRQVRVILDTGGDYELIEARSLMRPPAGTPPEGGTTVSVDVGGFTIPRLQALTPPAGCRECYLGGRILMQYRVTFDCRRGKVYLQLP